MMMKNRFLLAGLPVIALALVMTVAGCKYDEIEDYGSFSSTVPSRLIGTWEGKSSYGSTTYTIEFTSTRFIDIDGHRYSASVREQKPAGTFNGVVVATDVTGIGKKDSFRYDIYSDGTMRISYGAYSYGDLNYIYGGAYFKKK